MLVYTVLDPPPFYSFLSLRETHTNTSCIIESIKIFCPGIVTFLGDDNNEGSGGAAMPASRHRCLGSGCLAGLHNLRLQLVDVDHTVE
jgi:hypothetical protein